MAKISAFMVYSTINFDHRCGAVGFIFSPQYKLWSWSFFYDINCRRPYRILVHMHADSYAAMTIAADLLFTQGSKYPHDLADISTMIL